MERKSKQMLIEITYQDIEKGNASLDACPITIALRRYFGDKVSVSRNFIRVLNKKTKDKWTLLPLPAPARNFLLDYYLYQSPRPLNFVLPARSVKALKG